MIEVEGPDGSVAEFPDGTSPEVIKGAMAKRFAKPKAETNPVLDSPIGGFLRGLRDIPDAGAQLLTRGLEAVAPTIDNASGLPPEFQNNAVQNFARQERERVEGINKAAEQDYRQSWRGGQDPGIDAGRIAGNVAGTLPLAMALPGGGATFMGRLAAGAGQGAALGALNPVDTEQGDFWPEKASQVLTGAGLGAAGTGIVEGISRAISPRVVPEVQALMDRGVTPTPGQILGGGFKRAEEGLTSVPVVGDAIKGAQRRAIEQFNTAVLDDALKPIGQAVPKGLQGREAIEATGKTISQAYDDLLPKLSASIDYQFMDDLAKVGEAARILPTEKANQLAKILEDALSPRVGTSAAQTTLPAIPGQAAPSANIFSGEALKDIQSRLGSRASAYMGSGDPDQRLMGEALQGASQALKDLVKRSNPQFAEQLSNIDNAYAQFLRAQTAAGRIGAKEGIFSPAQYNSAVREMDKSLRKSQFARGNALGQEFGTQAESVLGATVPDSGSPFRIANALMLGGGYAIDPTVAAGTLAAAAPYTPMGQRIMANLLANRPAGAQSLAQEVQKLSPLAAALMASGQ